MQWLEGGRNIYIYGSGKTIVRIVNYNPIKRGLFQKEYIILLNDHEIKKLINIFILNDFINIETLDRPGACDEAKPKIILINSIGKSKQVSKWDADKIRKFDTIYQQLLSIEKKTEKLVPISESVYN